MRRHAVLFFGPTQNPIALRGFTDSRSFILGQVLGPQDPWNLYIIRDVNYRAYRASSLRGCTPETKLWECNADELTIVPIPNHIVGDYLAYINWARKHKEQK